MARYKYTLAENLGNNRKLHALVADAHAGKPGVTTGLFRNLFLTEFKLADYQAWMLSVAFDAAPGFDFGSELEFKTYDGMMDDDYRAGRTAAVRECGSESLSVWEQVRRCGRGSSEENSAAIRDVWFRWFLTPGEHLLAWMNFLAALELPCGHELMDVWRNGMRKHLSVNFRTDCVGLGDADVFLLFEVTKEVVEKRQTMEDEAEKNIDRRREIQSDYQELLKNLMHGMIDRLINRGVLWGKGDQCPQGNEFVAAMGKLLAE